MSFIGKINRGKERKRVEIDNKDTRVHRRRSEKKKSGKPILKYMRIVSLKERG